MLPYLIATGIVLAFALAWWLIFRVAMRSPNQGNDHSYTDSRGYSG